ncbi:MaoC family dehydratase [Pseudooceanicola sp.]|uniref:MaoC family dehydratase n=1 Tax=Pseudooceanicola sp. TaxID=1914328 RepID=UPI00260FC955|nr:MaoC family dehydratase [Pseudooceanicola sp.]MDF1857049.1 MaoC family dehydratase [Pseudooceanicola sp.]
MTPDHTLQPGATLPDRVHKVTQPLIDAYARVSGDHNPLHTDPEFASTTHFGGTIAHGMMTLAFASAAMEAWAGPDWAQSGAMDVTFLSPVLPGSEVVVSIEVPDAAVDGRLECRINCTVAGKAVLTGAVSIAAKRNMGTT